MATLGAVNFVRSILSIFMNDEQRKHRVIGIRHALKTLKMPVLFQKVNYPDHAVGELLKILAKANGKRFRVGRSDAQSKND